MDSASECQEKCSNQDGCTHFNWIYESGNAKNKCWLKEETDTKPVTENDVVGRCSGLKNGCGMQTQING